MKEKYSQTCDTCARAHKQYIFPDIHSFYIFNPFEIYLQSAGYVDLYAFYWKGNGTNAQNV